jgi:glycosyltransferase involved in cell wall biosynthesis
MSTNHKKGILLLTDIFGRVGGAERNITQLMIGIDKDKFELFIACFVSGKLVENLRNQGFSILDLNKAGIYTISGLRNLAFLKRFVAEKKIYLIVTYHESSDFYGLVLSHICNVPIISARRDMGFKTELHHQLAYKFVGRFFDAVIAVSNAVKKEIVKRRWFPEKKIFTIYNAINMADYGKSRNGMTLKRELGIHPESPVVGMVANIHKIKGYEYFLHAASMIHRYKHDVQFLMIGYDEVNSDFTIATLKRYGEEIGISQNLHFLGGREDTADLISIFDVAVLASLSEGFSNVILEYMASSKPVVATEVGGNPEIVLHGKTGLLVPPADADALASAILSILGDREAASKFGIAGRRRVEEEFSLDVMVRNYENLFEQVINSRGNISPAMLT